jgi:hypothetical protein
MNDQEQINYFNNYGTPDSYLLKEVFDAGFKPIGITVMLCEETFIFKSELEANEAAKKFLPEGWWYGIGSYIDARKQYIKKFCDGDNDMAGTEYWFDKNYITK